MRKWQKEGIKISVQGRGKAISKDSLNPKGALVFVDPIDAGGSDWTPQINRGVICHVMYYAATRVLNYRISYAIFRDRLLVSSDAEVI